MKLEIDILIWIIVKFQLSGRAEKVEILKRFAGRETLMRFADYVYWSTRITF